MYLKKLFIVFTICSVLFACTKEEAEPTTNTPTSQFCTNDNRFTNAEFFAESAIEVQTNISYGSAVDWQGNNTNLLLDVYMPKASEDELTTRPAIMIIHGGGFQGGNKEQWSSECMEFAKRGFVAFTISYRLGWNTADPADQLVAIYRANQDANAALRYIVQNAPTFGVDTEWVFVGGGSAGAITSLATVYGDQSEWNTLIPSIEQQLGGLNTSSNSLTNTYAIKGVFNNWGATFLPFMQPEEMVPTISFHGELDNTVPIDEGENGLIGSRVIHNTLVANNVCGDLTVQPDGFHGIYRSSLDGVAFRVSRAACFFKSVMCNNCNSFLANERVEPNCAQ